MCSQCEAKADYYGVILPGEHGSYSDDNDYWYLMRATKNSSDWLKDDWGFIQINNPSFIYDGDFYDSSFEEEKHFEALFNLDDWLNTMDVMSSYNFVCACKRAGYDPEIHGYRISSWFMDHVARYLATKPKIISHAEQLESGDMK